MTIETLEELAAAKTFRDFFADLAGGTYVHRTVSGRVAGDYIYHSFIYEGDAENPSILLFDARYGERYIVSHEVTQHVNDMFTVIIENDEPKMVGEFVSYLLKSNDRYRQDSERHYREKRDVTTKLESLESEVKLFNDMLNSYADHNAYYGKMCGEYENQLTRWNESLTMFQLVGRPREFTIPVDINGSRFYLRVDGFHSEDEATQAVRSCSPGEIMSRLVNDGANFYNFTIEVDGEQLSDEPPF